MKLELLESRHLLSGANNGQIETESDGDQSEHPHIKSTNDSSDHDSPQHTTHSSNADLWSAFTKDPVFRSGLLIGLAAGLTDDQLFMRNTKPADRILTFSTIFTSGTAITSMTQLLLISKSIELTYYGLRIVL